MTPRALAVPAALVVLGALLLAPPTPARAQATGVVQGRVVEEATGRPLPGAVISVPGTELRTRTDRLGRFRLVGVPAGGAVLRVELEGYVTTVDRVLASPDWITEIDFPLAPIAAVLDRLTVTARRGTPGGGSQATVRADQVAERPRASAAEALVGRVPGALVFHPSGQVGAGTRVLLRGIKSFVLANDPIVYVDGVRVSYQARGVSLSGAAGPTVLDMIDPSSIERIEVLRGPSAAVQYGSEATNGVILIYTKSGGRTPPPE